MDTSEHGSSSTIHNRRKVAQVDKEEEEEEEPDVNGYDFPFPSERETEGPNVGIGSVLEELFYVGQ